MYKYVLRLDDELADKIQKSADKNKRSFNSEVVIALEKYIESEDK